MLYFLFCLFPPQKSCTIQPKFFTLEKPAKQFSCLAFSTPKFSLVSFRRLKMRSIEKVFQSRSFALFFLVRMNPRSRILMPRGVFAMLSRLGFASSNPPLFRIVQTCVFRKRIDWTECHPGKEVYTRQPHVFLPDDAS
jgi:hypothetical protein